MSLRVYKTASGVPLIHATGTADVVARTSSLQWTVAHGVDAPDWFTDPACPIGERVTYTQARSSSTYTRPSVSKDILTSENGRECLDISIISDLREIKSGEAAFTLASGNTVYRYPVSAPDPHGELNLECSEAVANKLATLIRAGQAFWLAHNRRLCEVPGCDRPSAVALRPLEITRYSRTARKDTACVNMSITYAAIQLRESKGISATVGEACRANAKCGESLERIVKRVNGVS